ncbi:MAG: hypothetical protein HZA91_18640 [Verrucomicrobia bacterium]|nr:hypothetical protein [Verrucomicrobiota bacterium]
MKTFARLASLLAAAVLSLASAAADPSAESVLARAGAEGLGYLRIERPEVALGKMDGITRKLGGRVGDLLPLVAQRFMKNPMLAGVDLQRPCTVVFLNPAKFTNDLAIIIGVSDAALFCDSFGKGGVNRVEADPATAGAAVRHFTEPVEEFDRRGFMAALQAGEQADPAKFKKQVTRHYFVTVRGNEGLIVGDRGLLEPGKGGGLRLTRAVAGDITAACNVPALLGIYEKELRQQAAVTRSGSPTGGEVAVRRGRIHAAAMDSLLSVTKQIESLEVGAELIEGQLKVRLGLRPLAKTPLAGVLAAQSPAALDAGVMSLMPADAAMLGCWQTAQTPETIEFCTQYLQPILQAAAPTNTATASASLADIMRENMEVRAGAAGVALKSQPAGQTGFDMIQAYRVKDAARARAAQRKAATAGVQALSGFLSEAESGRTKFQPNVARHAGVEIDQMTFDLAGSGSPASQGASRNPFGTNLVSRTAFAGQFGLGATGPRAAENIRQLIGLAKKPPATPIARPRFDAAVAGFPKRLNGVFFMQVEDYFKIATGAMPSAVAAEGGRLYELLDRLQADIAGFFTLTRAAATAEVVVPLDKLLELSRKSPSQPAEQ